jgi:tetratricopeptide (TPR) repeat protein
MSEPEHPERKTLIGASIPRSGHHYLARILNVYFENQIHYCEWYGPPDCCKQVPCARPGGFRVVYQKSHDWDFTLTQAVSGALYVIQCRHPVPEALSDRDLLTDSFGGPSINYRLSREYYGWWLATKAIYYRKFHDKWIDNAPANSVSLSYEALLKDSVAALEPIIGWAAGKIDRERLRAAVATASPARHAGPNAPIFTPRAVETSRHFDRDLLAPFEAYVLERCPRFGYEPQLSGSYRDHWIYGLVLAQDPEEPLPSGETNRLDAAARRAPGHPEIVSRLAKREMENGELDSAILLLEQAISNHPFYGHAYRLMVDACKAASRPIPAICTGSEAVFACAENPGALVEIGGAMLNDDRPANAAAALSLATLIQPENFRANHLLARSLTRLGRWTQAKHYAEKASELKPDNDQNTKLLTRIVRRQA